MQPLTAEEIGQTTNGNTLYHRDSEGRKSVIYYRDDGTRTVRLGGKQTVTKWWIKDGKRCEQSVFGGDICFTIFKTSDGYLACFDKGACRFHIDISNGNAENLN